MQENKVYEHLGFGRWWGGILTLVVIVSLLLLLLVVDGSLITRDQSLIAIAIMFVVCLGFMVVTWFVAEITFGMANERTSAAERQIADQVNKALFLLFDSKSPLWSIIYRAVKQEHNKKAWADFSRIEQSRNSLRWILNLTDPDREKTRSTQFNKTYEETQKTAMTDSLKEKQKKKTKQKGSNGLT